jgi:hypothetical protein
MLRTAIAVTFVTLSPCLAQSVTCTQIGDFVSCTDGSTAMRSGSTVTINPPPDLGRLRNDDRLLPFDPPVTCTRFGDSVTCQ